MNGMQTLLYKETLRFWKVGFQTVGAPVLTAVMYMLIFGHVLEGQVKVYGTINYTAFLVPGLVMMSVLQNAFANSSSSLIQSKIMGSLVFVLLTPLSHWHWFFAYVGASVARGAIAWEQKKSRSCARRSDALVSPLAKEAYCNSTRDAARLTNKSILSRPCANA